MRNSKIKNEVKNLLTKLFKESSLNSPSKFYDKISDEYLKSRSWDFVDAETFEKDFGISFDINFLTFLQSK